MDFRHLLVQILLGRCVPNFACSGICLDVVGLRFRLTRVFAKHALVAEFLLDVHGTQVQCGVFTPVMLGQVPPLLLSV